ncbi:MAG: nucleotidyltransferase family protein [Caulobacter sp.]|nr:nucleotidyltransferase family protein [Caulobacter sp.]
MATGALSESRPRRLETLILAAGSGSRFGGRKLLAPWRGGLVLEATLAAAFQAPGRSVRVVTGADGQAVGDAARAYADRTGQAGRLKIVHAAAHADGLAASLKVGIESLPDGAEGIFLFLGDMPLVPPETAGQLLAVLGPDQQAAAPLFEGQRGHPVLMMASLFPALARLTGDRGAGALLTSLGYALALMETGDPGVLKDIDRREDLE